MRWLLTFLCLAVCLFPTWAADSPANGFIEVDYAKVDRTIAKEPRYLAEPRYALFIFDPAGKFQVWAVFDKSKADLPYYDIAYFDLNGNRDLTERGERFQGKYDKELEPAGMGLTIRIGKVPVPGTSLVHTNFLFSTTPKANRKGFWFRMMWDGKEEVSGGYGPVGIDTTVYGESAKTAPVLRPTTLGPLSFACWMAEPVTLPIGKSAEVNLLIGSQGSGPDTLCSLSETFLVEGQDLIVGTLIAKDKDGKEVRSRNEIKKHC